MYRDSTLAVRTGQYPDLSDSHCEPIAFTSAFTFKSAEDAAGKFQGTIPGNVYARFTNPTVRAFEERLAALEKAEDCVSFSSGMAAISAVGMAFLQAGNSIVCSRDVFGTTLNAFRTYFSRFGVEIRTVDLTDLDEWRQAIDHTTRLAFLETPSNPGLDIVDINAVCQIAHAQGALVAVDNTMLTPVFQKPLLAGADIVIHSAGKYIDGQGRCVAGAVAGNAVLMRELRGVLRSLGYSLSPMNAWLLTKSMETLEIRMHHVNQTATYLSEWLQELDGVHGVNYTGLPDHPQHALALRQQQGHGGLLSFRISGGRERAWRFINALRLISIATNIGDTRTMITHPASTTHHKLSPEEKRLTGIDDSLLRLSVGLEHVCDLKQDIWQALVESDSRAATPMVDFVVRNKRTHASTEVNSCLHGLR